MWRLSSRGSFLRAAEGWPEVCDGGYAAHMSRSVHQTVKGVYGGKTLEELRQMGADPDEDQLALVEKKRFKRLERNQRARLHADGQAPGTWRPASEADLADAIECGVAKMNSTQLKAWCAVEVPPERWSLPPWSDNGGGFWVVAVYGSAVVWFNDIEEGFNLSSFQRWGVIDEYGCEQSELEVVIQQVVDTLMV